MSAIYKGHQNPNQVMVVVFAVTTCVLMIFFVGARVYARRSMHAPHRRDDIMLYVAGFLGFCFTTLVTITIDYGLGHETPDIKPRLLPILYKVRPEMLIFCDDQLIYMCMQLYFSMAFLFPLTASASKASICVTYRRIFPGPADRIITYSIFVFLGVYWLTASFIVLFQCHPIKGYWNHIKRVKCAHTKANLM
jgi:drug/metabolite transporter (DMT)-like permease